MLTSESIQPMLSGSSGYANLNAAAPGVISAPFSLSTSAHAPAAVRTVAPLTVKVPSALPLTVPLSLMVLLLAVALTA